MSLKARGQKPSTCRAHGILPDVDEAKRGHDQRERGRI